jgi:hypothetical protein
MFRKAQGPRHSDTSNELSSGYESLKSIITGAERNQLVL